MKNLIPVQLRNQFKTFEDYKSWCMEKSKQELLNAFESTKTKNDE